jgi:hypothetical protein
MRRAFLVAAIGAAAAGCGGSRESSDPVALAAEKTSHVATARFTMNISIRDPQQGSLDFHGPGVVSDHGHKGRVNYSDFGRAPAIAVPTQSRVVDVTKLAGGLP